ncbi:MAG: AAA family ATPase [Acidobacteria bacterium]|nr:AAA family ATPase [Acidobacteriota bacterium]
MYEGFYGLRRSPFSHTPDPGFLFLTDSHRDAAAGLTYAILARKGFSVLTGDAGTGKTTLLRSVMSTIPDSRVQASFVLNPMVSADEFLEMAMSDFGILTIPSSKAQRIAVLQQFLLDVHAEGRVAVLIVDEAHRLSVDLLEEIRLLTNFETDREKLLQIIMAGQDELGDTLDRHEVRQLKQRVAIRLHIRPLTVSEVGDYIRHRWQKVSDRPAPFTADSMRLIAHYSGGVPRVVNSICDNALLLGFAQGALAIQRDQITEVATDLHLIGAPHSTSSESDRPVLVSSNRVASPRTTGPTEERHEKIELRIPKPAPRPTEANPIPTLDRYTPARPWRVRLGLRPRGVEG